MNEILKPGIGVKVGADMVPLDMGRSRAELIRSALWNIERWDKKPILDPELDKDEIEARTKAKKPPRDTPRNEFALGIATIAARQGWTAEQCEQVRELMRQRPPNAVYRIKAGFHSLKTGAIPIAIVVSYRPGQHGGAAEAGMAILGFSNDQIGSAAQPFGVPAEGLEDVTAACRDGTLPELKGP